MIVRFPIFLSLVIVVRNQALLLQDIITESTSVLSKLVSDYECILVDNASEDDSVSILRSLTLESGVPNLQVYALMKEVDVDTAAWVGLDNALGDFIVVIDPFVDDIQFLPTMLEKAVSGADVVFANNIQKPPQGCVYSAAYSIFNRLYRCCSGVNLAHEAPQYRVLSKQVVNCILQHPQPMITYRHLPATGGFVRENLTYSAKPKVKVPFKRLSGSIERGLRLAIATTRAPMRIVTTLSLFGAIANFLYSLYIVSIAFFKTDVASGWVSLSLQQSGMFFLISLVLMVLGEYILQMARLSNEGPQYHVGQTFSSMRMTRHEKLNIEERGCQKKQ